MEAIKKLFCRTLLLFLLYQSGIVRTQQSLTTPGFIKSTCFSSVFRMTLDESFLQKKFTRIEIIDPSGVIIPLDDKLKARCGYVKSKDAKGNTVFRASLLGCHVVNEMDERFSLTVNIKVSPFEDMRAAANYPYRLHCSYFPWAPREIVCEENYMEVSVKSDVPVISDDETAEWMSALPEEEIVLEVYGTFGIKLPVQPMCLYYGIGYDIIKAYHTSIILSNHWRKTIVVSDADKLGYSFNNTLARVFLRSPYSTNETEYSMVNGVTMSTVSSTSMYKQRWLLLLIDTTVSCPVDGISFTDATITWTVPAIIPRLALQELTFTSLNISIGVDGERIENPEKCNFTLERNTTHIAITIPIGASRGNLKSTVSNGIHGVTYRIDLFLEHAWTDTDWHLTKYTVIKPITTPFMPRIPTVVNNTVPETRLFVIVLGFFLPDVTVVALTIGGIPFSLNEAVQRGYKISDTPFPNGTKGFKLEVPFDDPNVVKEYVNKNETKYRLRVNYTLHVGPEQKLYHHPADVECIMADIELPEGIGYCDKVNLYLAITVTNLYKYWSLYVGNKPLDQASAIAAGYLMTTNDTHVVLQVPLFAAGIIYEEVSFERILARFDLALKKVITMETVDIFSIRCNFRSSQFIVCYPNGTVTVSALMKTAPSIDMGKTRLKDSTCKPKEFTKEKAFFQFHVSTCGTSLRLEGERLIYENEISFEKETLPAQGPPMITRDPEYRLTILCYYPVKETLMQSATFYGSSPRMFPPFGYGTMMAQSNLAGHRRKRQLPNIISNVFKDESFRETYGPHSIAIKYSWEPLFLEVELKDEAPEVELYLDNCWMAEAEGFSSIPQWNIIANGCENRSNGYVNFYPVIKSNRVKYPNHFRRVRMQMQTLPPREVFFHCTVIVGTCLHAPVNGLSWKQCLSGRKFDQHSEIHPSRHGYVVAGPVLILHPEQIKELEMQRNRK